MSDIVDRITAVVEPVIRHDLNAPVPVPSSLIAAHVAERVAAELQLTEEWRVMDEDEQIAWPPSLQAAHNVAAISELHGETPVIEGRWASAWSEVQP